MVYSEVKILQKNVVNFQQTMQVRDHYTGEYTGAAHSICSSKYSVPQKIPTAFHNGSNHHFIKKELAEEFKNNLFV